jgi:predicted N-acyltransferase
MGGSSHLRAELGDHTVFARPEVAALYGDRGEGPEFLLALGAGNAAQMRAVVAMRGSEVVAAASMVLLPMDIAAEEPRLRRPMAALRKFRPDSGYVKLHGLGGLHTGEPQIVISGRLDAAARDAALVAMLEVAEAEAARLRAQCHFLMDMAEEDAAWARPLMKARGYLTMAGAPMVWQHLPFTSMDDYLATRSGPSRYKLRKALARARAEIEVSETTSVDAALDLEIEALARSMQQHARVSLGGIELMPEGFHRRLAASGRVHVLLYRLAGRLVGFAYLIDEGEATLAKTMGLFYPEALDYNLIHFNLCCVIEAAIRRGKQWLVLGQGGYPTKLLFGAQLVRRTSFIKGRGMMGLVLPLVEKRLDEFNPTRHWAETLDPANYFDAQPERIQPPVKRIWVPQA